MTTTTAPRARDLDRPAGRGHLSGMDLDFTDDELQRYSRHILLAEVGGIGQAKLKAARVLVIGAGGLGSPLLLYLAAAGIGTIGIVDDDEVDLSNLQRQIAHTTARVGMAKALSAADAAWAINPDVKLDTHKLRLSADNALDIIGRYDIVCDGTDNFATRFMVSDACVLAKRTLVSAAVLRFEGQLSVFKPHEGGPCYRCLYHEAPPPGVVPSCSEAGVLGAVTGVMGTLAGHRNAEGNSGHRREPVGAAAGVGRPGEPVPHGEAAARSEVQGLRAGSDPARPVRAHRYFRTRLCRLSPWACCCCPAATTARTTPLSSPPAPPRWAARSCCSRAIEAVWVWRRTGRRWMIPRVMPVFRPPVSRAWTNCGRRRSNSASD